MLSPQKSPTKPPSKACYDTASLKPVTIRHSKDRYNMAPLKPITIWHSKTCYDTALLKASYDTTTLKVHCYTEIFLQNPTKLKYYFGIILQSPNTNLALVL